MLTVFLLPFKMPAEIGIEVAFSCRPWTLEDKVSDYARLTEPKVLPLKSAPYVAARMQFHQHPEPG